MDWPNIYIMTLGVVVGTVPLTDANTSLAAPALESYPIIVRDDSGVMVQLATPARRIVTLAPHAAELVFAAGAGMYLSGVVAFSDYPPAAANIPVVGDAGLLNREIILKLKPDLCITWPSGNRPQDLAWLKRHGFMLYHSDPKFLAAIAANLRAIGQLTKTTTTAEIAAAAYETNLAELQQRYASNPPRRMFYQIWPTPLITVGANHLVSQALAICGGRHLFPDLSSAAAVVSKEAIILADPEVIVADDDDGMMDVFGYWRHWTWLSVVRNRHFIAIPAGLLQRPTPRIVDGIARLCVALQPHF